MKRLGLTAFLALLSVPAFAGNPDFYGVQMRSEALVERYFADGLTPATNLDAASGVDKSVTATAGWGGFPTGGLSIHISNKSERTISAKNGLTDVQIYTKDGSIHRVDGPYSFFFHGPDHIGPRGHGSIGVSMAGINVKKEDVKMIVCRLDMGDTKIVLLPQPKAVKAAPVKAASKPAAKPAPAVSKDAKKEPAVTPAKTTSNVVPKAKPAPAPTVKPVAKSGFQWPSFPNLFPAHKAPAAKTTTSDKDAAKTTTNFVPKPEPKPVVASKPVVVSKPVPAAKPVVDQKPKTAKKIFPNAAQQSSLRKSPKPWDKYVVPVEKGERPPEYYNPKKDERKLDPSRQGFR